MMNKENPVALEAHFQDIASKIINELNQAKQNILIAMAWFTNKHLFNVILQKAKEGVKVELIIINDEINNNESSLPFQMLIDLGVKFYFGDNTRLMHNKFCIIDRHTLINGSYNWTYWAEYKNNENIIIFNQNYNIVNQFSNNFYSISGKLRAIKIIVPNQLINQHEIEIIKQESIYEQEFILEEIEKHGVIVVSDDEILNWWKALDTNWQLIFLRNGLKDDHIMPQQIGIDKLMEVLNLKKLSCNYKKINNVVPLNLLTNLTNLQIAGNQINDLSILSNLNNLEELNISGNKQIDSLNPLINLKKMSKLWCYNTPSLSLQEIENFKKHLPDCEIER